MIRPGEKRSRPIVNEAPPSPPQRRRLSRGTIIALLAVALLAAGTIVWAVGWRGSGGPASQPPAGTGTTTGAPGTSVPPASALPPVTGLKPPLRGLLDRSGPPKEGLPLGGWVVQTTWAELQPSAGGPLAEQNPVDQAIAEVRRRRAAGLAEQGVKLRIYAGTGAPEWAKRLDGEPIPVSDPNSGGGGTVGRFWLPSFGTAYASFHRSLAARYDTVPEVREVVIDRCTTVFAEPMIRQRSDPASSGALLRAGYTDALDLACQREEIDAHDVWKQTSSDLAANPYQALQRNGPADLGTTTDLMTYCRSRLGRRCILENNSLRSDPSDPNKGLYEAMQRLGAPLSFQTAAPRRIGDLAKAVGRGTELGAASIELPSSYAQLAPDELGRMLGGAIAKLGANP